MDLTYQEPAQGIMKINDWGHSKMYKISCECGDDNHDIVLDVEADDTGIAVRHYVNVETAWWNKPTPFYWLNSILHRVKVTWEVWTQGSVKLEATSLMNEQTALNYADTLKKAIEDVKNFKKSPTA